MENEPQVPISDMQLDTPPPRAPQFAQKAVAHKKRMLLIGGAVLLVLLLGGAGYWFFMLRGHQTKQPTQAPKTNTQANQEAVATDPTIVSFKSDTLNLEFSHRKDWRVKESPDKSEVIVTSPATAVARADGSSGQSVFTLKIRHGVIPQAIQDTVVKSIAVRDSIIVAYDAPTTSQRQYTNISDAGPDANSFGFLIVSGSAAYKAGQAIGYGVSLTGQDSYLFAGGYGQDKDDSLAFDPVSKNSFATDIYDQAVAIVKSVKIY